MTETSSNSRPPPTGDAGHGPRSGGFLKIRHLYVLALLPALLLAATPRPLEWQLDGYRVRASTVVTGFLPQQSRQTHDVKSNGRGVINVVVLKQGLTGPVPADVSVTITDPAGRSRSLDMRAVTENDMTSYLGSFDVEHNQTLDFEIQVSPRGVQALRTFEFERRFFVE